MPVTKIRLKINQKYTPLSTLQIDRGSSEEEFHTNVRKFSQFHINDQRLRGYSVNEALRPFRQSYPICFPITDWSSAELFITMCVIDYFRYVEEAA